MFFGSTSSTISFILGGLIVSLLFALFILNKKRNKLLSLFVFSLLGNIILYITSNSTVFDIYNLKWIVKFTLWYWPWINVGLLAILAVNYLRNKGKNQNLG